MEAYLHDIERSLRLDPEETRAIVAEVRGNLEDLIAHLKGQGYSPDEAEREALRRFDDARGLATALRRAHRRAPLALHLLAALLVTMGVAGLIIGFQVLASSVAVATSPNTTTLNNAASAFAFGIIQLIPVHLYVVQGLIALLILITPGIVILVMALASLWAALAVVSGQRRPRWRRVGIGMSVAALCDVALTLVLLSTVQGSAAGPRAIPGGKQLAAAGLCFRPARNQPTSPVVVDRLCADRTATYLQYHVPDPARGEPAPNLYDARVYAPRHYTDPTYPMVSCSPCAGYSTGTSASQGLRAFMPWHGSESGQAQFAALDARAHEVVLTMGQYAMAPGSEVVHIPVDLRAWSRIGGGTHPFIVTSAHGVRVSLTRVVRGVSGLILDYTIDATPALVPRGSYIATVQATLTGKSGHVYEQLPSPYGYGCRQVERGGGHCAPETLYTPARRGEHLTLTVQGFSVYSSAAPGRGGRFVASPWRISFVMP